MGGGIFGETNMENSILQGLSGEVKLRYEEVLSQLCLIGRINEQVALLEDMPRLCLSIVGAIIDFTSAENCSIMLNDPETGELKLFVAKGKGDGGSFFGSDKPSTTILSAGEGVAGLVAERGQMISINDCESDLRFVALQSASKKVNSMISAPLLSDDSVMGVINCSHSEKGRFREIDRQNVALVADHTATLLQTAICMQERNSRHNELEQQLDGKTNALSAAEKKLAETQEQLYMSEKFAALGELLASVAHELNNRVAPILIYSQILQQSVTGEKDEKRLHVIEESAIGAKAILETLLSYSREGNREKEAINLNQTLQNTLTLTEYKMRNHGIKLSVDISPHLPPTKVNEKQMAQVFLNIINNAIHSMENTGGTLSIQSAYDDEKVEFKMSDTGPGVPGELSEKIFDPFFTTKESGKGTGLGLSISKKYVEENGGKIRIDPAYAGGAAFVIEIPRMEARGETSEVTAERAQQPENLARILVVDDDSTISDVIRDVLGPNYLVEFAVDGRDATEKIEGDSFDLLLVDYHMPSLDGKQLYEWVAGNHPSLKRRIVFSTGDIFDEKIRDFIDGTGCRCLIKPFTTASLREIVSDTLRSGAPA